MPDPATLEPAPGLRVVWDDVAEARSKAAAGEASWRLQGELGESHSALRVLTAAPRKGGLLLLAAARPSGAAGHDSENPQAILVAHSGDVKVIEEALMSTQYSAGGDLERVGLELYGEGDDYPVRGAGDATRLAATDDGALRHEQAWLDFRLDGEHGVAILDILRA